jgi:hypothetical protein
MNKIGLNPEHKRYSFYTLCNRIRKKRIQMNVEESK